MIETCRCLKFQSFHIKSWRMGEVHRIFGLYWSVSHPLNMEVIDYSLGEFGINENYVPWFVGRHDFLGVWQIVCLFGDCHFVYYSSHVLFVFPFLVSISPLDS